MNLDAGRSFKIESKTNTATTLLTNATTGPSYWLLVFKGRNRCFARRRQNDLSFLRSTFIDPNEFTQCCGKRSSLGLGERIQV
jgi:hypothetical protein